MNYHGRGTVVVDANEEQVTPARSGVSEQFEFRLGRCAPAQDLRRDFGLASNAESVRAAGPNANRVVPAMQIAPRAGGSSAGDLPADHPAAASGVIIQKLGMAVLACGPVPLVASCQAAAFKYGCDFHKETFFL